MSRIEAWPERMAEAIAAAEEKPFEWGAHDCAVFTASVVEAMTGEDPMGDLRGAYTDAESAKDAIQAAGHADLFHLLKDRFGDPVPRALAGRGDIAIAAGEDGPALGIVEGSKVAFVGSAYLGDLEAHGLMRVARSDDSIRFFFRV